MLQTRDPVPLLVPAGVNADGSCGCPRGERGFLRLGGEDSAMPLNLPDGRAGVPLALTLLRLGSRGFIPL